MTLNPKQILCKSLPGATSHSLRIKNMDDFMRNHFLMFEFASPILLHENAHLGNESQPWFC